MRRLLFLLGILLIVLFSVTACNGGGVGDEVTNPESEAPENKVMIYDGGEVFFKVVRPKGCGDYVTDAYNKLKKAIREASGDNVDSSTDYVSQDQQIPNESLEILLGTTNRQASIAAATKCGAKEWYISFDGVKLVITSDSDVGVLMGTLYFIENYVNKSEGSFALPVGMEYKSAYSYPVSLLLEEKLGKELTYDYDNGTCAEKLAPSDVIYNGEILYLDLYDMATSLLSRDSLAAFDAHLAVVALQGLANRENPRILIRNRPQDNGNSDQWVDGIEADLYWLYVYSGQGQYLSEAELTKVDFTKGSEYEAIRTLFESCRDSFNGLVVWEADVPATMLAACTAAGVDNLIPVRYDTSKNSVYTYLTGTLGYEVKLDLTGHFTGKTGEKIWQTEILSSGSAKNDVYLWALETYLKSGKTSSDYLCLTRDGLSYSSNKLSYQAPHNTVLSYFDFLISEKAFFFSLLGTGVGTPQDDKTQPAGTDYDTFNKILAAQYTLTGGEFYHVVGWPSVDDGVSDGTQQEWQTTELISSYHGVLEMEGNGFSAAGNVSLFRHVPPLQSYEQKAQKKNTEYNKNRIYVAFYMGDYDSLGWLTNVLPTVWESDGRGKLPLAWGIGSMQGERAVHIYNYMYQTATENDYFVAINNGAGYLNPQMLYPENKDPNYAKRLVPIGIDQWVTLCTKGYAKYDLSITPFIIPNGLQSVNSSSTLYRALTKYLAFSRDGLGYYNWTNEVLFKISGTAVAKTIDGATNMATAEQVYEKFKAIMTDNALRVTQKKCFLIREIIVDPAVIVAAVERFEKEYPNVDFEVVDIYTFYEFAAKRA